MNQTFAETKYTSFLYQFVPENGNLVNPSVLVNQNGKISNNKIPLKIIIEAKEFPTRIIENQIIEEIIIFVKEPTLFFNCEFNQNAEIFCFNGVSVYVVGCVIKANLIFIAYGGNSIIINDGKNINFPEQYHKNNTFYSTSGLSFFSGDETTNDKNFYIAQGRSDFILDDTQPDQKFEFDILPFQHNSEPYFNISDFILTSEQNPNLFTTLNIFINEPYKIETFICPVNIPYKIFQLEDSIRKRKIETFLEKSRSFQSQIGHQI